MDYSIKKVREISVAKFNHCSSVCCTPFGQVITWYSGTTECAEDQCVYALFINQTGESSILQIDNNSGNPIVWYDDGYVTILWARFTNHPVSQIVDKWKYCDLYMQKFEVTPTKLVMLTPKCLYPILDNHLLPRCNPIIIDNDILIPLYDELEEHGALFSMSRTNSDSVQKLGEIGVGYNIIQPTIWFEDDKLKSLSRNFNNNHFARYSEATKPFMRWSNPAETVFPNVNNSLHAIMHNNTPMCVWNDSWTGRYNLSLGQIVQGDLHVGNRINFTRHNIIDTRGSYPSIASDGQKLHITYSNRAIMYVTTELEEEVELTIPAPKDIIKELIEYYETSNSYYAFESNS